MIAFWATNFFLKPRSRTYSTVFRTKTFSHWKSVQSWTLDLVSNLDFPLKPWPSRFFCIFNVTRVAWKNSEKTISTMKEVPFLSRFDRSTWFEVDLRDIGLVVCFAIRRLVTVYSERTSPIMMKKNNLSRD